MTVDADRKFWIRTKRPGCDYEVVRSTTSEHAAQFFFMVVDVQMIAR